MMLRQRLVGGGDTEHRRHIATGDLQADGQSLGGDPTRHRDGGGVVTSSRRIRHARAVLDETATAPRLAWLDFPLVSVAVHQIRAMTRRHKPGRLNDSPRRIVDVSLAYIAALDMDVS